MKFTPRMFDPTNKVKTDAKKDKLQAFTVRLEWVSVNGRKKKRRFNKPWIFIMTKTTATTTKIVKISFSVRVYGAHPICHRYICILYYKHT